MKLLLHACCGPCSIMPLEKLLAAGHDITVYFYNPNIHPYQEYKMRKNTLREYVANLPVTLVIEDRYDLEGFLRQTAQQVEKRCPICYQMRLQQTAAYAQEQGFDAFSTTLLVSTYQNHQAIREIGERMAEQYQVPFHYEDFRPYFQEGQARAKELGLYLQKYCGCIYSEKDRYCRKNNRRLIFHR